MATTCDLTGLKNFKAKIRNFEKTRYKDVQKMATLGIYQGFKEELSTQPAYQNAVVTTNDSRNRLDHMKTIVVVHMKDLWFIEYGTGYVGWSSNYPGDLPRKRLTFYSWGNMQSTQGWKYFYEPRPNGYTINTKWDRATTPYWYHGGYKHSGNIAFAGVYKSTLYAQMRTVELAQNGLLMIGRVFI